MGEAAADAKPRLVVAAMKAAAEYTQAALLLDSFIKLALTVAFFFPLVCVWLLRRSGKLSLKNSVCGARFCNPRFAVAFAILVSASRW